MFGKRINHRVRNLNVEVHRNITTIRCEFQTRQFRQNITSLSNDNLVFDNVAQSGHVHCRRSHVKVMKCQKLLLVTKTFSSVSKESSFAGTIVRSHSIATDCVNVTAVVVCSTLVYH